MIMGSKLVINYYSNLLKYELHELSKTVCSTIKRKIDKRSNSVVSCRRFSKAPG